MMLQDDPASSAVDLRTAAPSALRQACERSGLDSRGAEASPVVRQRRLPPSRGRCRRAHLLDDIAGRKGPLGDVGARDSVADGDRVPERGAAAGRPARCQRGLRGDVLALPSPGGPQPGPADLGRLLRALHQLEPPPIPLPAYQPLVSVRRAVESSRAIGEEERSWLTDRRNSCFDAYGQLSFQLPGGMIHGDAYRGNLLRDGHRAVLADWDAVSTGPREIDLVPTLQAPRFGLPNDERDAFIGAYGQDIRSWDGYPVLRDIRELSTLTALLRDGHTDTAAQRELQIRLRSLRSGDDRQWIPF